MTDAVILILNVIFWASTLAVFHSYVIYPLMLGWLTRKKENNCQVYDAGTSPGEWPYVVGVLAVHNEEAVLEKTLTSVFDSDYPEDRFELLIAADNCTDRSIEIIKQFQERHRNLRLRVFEGRNGKINVLNRMLGEQRVRLSLEGDYALIMFDANVCWAKDLPWRLVQHFRNPKIGQVGSNVLDSRKEHHGIADEEASYVNRENTIKFQEGVLWGRMMGAFGACYAMRGRLFEPVPEKCHSDDFFHTMRCFEFGYDAIIEPKAHAFEDVSEDIREEFRRKRRIAAANLRNLERFRKFLMPWRSGLATSFAFWSHKGLRWFGPLFLIAALVASAWLARDHWFYALAFFGQVAAFLAAATDAVLYRMNIHVRPLRFARYFLMMNLGLLLGMIRYFADADNTFWEPTRRVAEPGEDPAAKSNLKLQPSPANGFRD